MKMLVGNFYICFSPLIPQKLEVTLQVFSLHYIFSNTGKIRVNKTPNSLNQNSSIWQTMDQKKFEMQGTNNNKKESGY